MAEDLFHSKADTTSAQLPRLPVEQQQQDGQLTVSAELSTLVSRAMMVHWEQCRDAWIKFSKMTGDDVYAAFQSHHDLAFCLKDKFKNLKDGIALYTACDTSSKRALLRHFFGQEQVDQATTFLWFLLMLDQWRFCVPKLALYCNGDVSLAVQIQSTIRETYFPKSSFNHAEDRPAVHASRAILAWDNVERAYQPCLLIAYTDNMVRNAIQSDDFYIIKSSFPCHWRAFLKSGLFEKAPTEEDIVFRDAFFNIITGGQL